MLGIVPGSAGAITPTILTDELNADGDCSLREAVESARTNTAVSGCTTGTAGLDTITLGPSEYDLSLATGGNPEDGNAQGDLDLGGGPLAIAGASSSTTTIDAGGIVGGDRAIHLVLDVPATVSNLTITDGDTTAYLVGSPESRGGNVQVTQGSLTLANVVVADGEALQGGGVYTQNDATLAVNDSLLTGNTASINGGAMALTGSDSVTTISRSRLFQNHATQSAAGGDVEGGAIRHSADEELTIVDSELVDNDATNTSASANDTAWGGAIATASTTTIRRSLIAGNSAAATEATTAELAGGINAGGGGLNEPVAIINSTIYDNSAGAPNGDGGGLHNNGAAPVELRHVTFSANDAADEGDSIHAVAGTTTVRSSINPSADDPCDGPGISSTGFNAAAVDDPDCNYIASDSTSGGLIGIQSGGPADNGGFTDTIGLNAGGRALDLAPAASCSESQDQRGFFRPSGPGCDAGAYERVVCNGVVQEGATAVDCPPSPAVAPPPPPCSNLKGKKRKRCLCKQKKSKKKRKKCLKRLKGRKR